MKGFAKIALSVALIAVIVLSIVVASVAWFTSNPEVGANDVTIGSARTLTVTFDSNEEGSDFRYHGQKGNVRKNDASLDEPYVYEAGGFNVNINTLSSDDKHGQIKVEFGTVSIVTQSVGTIPDILITELFTITVNCYTKDDNGTYVQLDYRTGDPEKTINKNVFVDYRYLDRYTDSTLTEYDYDGAYAAYNGKAYLYADLEAKDKYVKNTYGVDEDGTIGDSGYPILFDEGTYALSFTFTFLPDAAYSYWQSRNYAAIEGFERSQNGDYIGVKSYTNYLARDHYGLQRYSRSGTAGNYTYTPNSEGAFVLVETSYEEYENVTKYDSEHQEAEDGEYIKVGDEYMLYYRYNKINGFPYSNDRYRGAKYTFKVNCSVEEV